MLAKIAFTKQFVRVGQNVLKIILPENRFGDRVFSFFDFLVQHRRLPKKIFGFNDVMYRIKSTNEILDPLRVFVSDKEFVKKYVKSVVGEKYCIPTIAILKNSDQIARYEFPGECCIKPTQASGRFILRKGNTPIDRDEISSWLRLDHYKKTREANYRYLSPKVIVEPLLFGDANIEDYRIFCFNGEPKFILVDIDTRNDHRRVLLDINWTPQDYSISYPKADITPKKPENLDEMLEVARKCSAEFDFIRVDLYSNGVSCYVGELTNCHASARGKFLPPSSEKAASFLLFGRD